MLTATVRMPNAVLRTVLWRRVAAGSPLGPGARVLVRKAFIADLPGLAGPAVCCGFSFSDAAPAQ